MSRLHRLPGRVAGFALTVLMVYVPRAMARLQRGPRI